MTRLPDRLVDRAAGLVETRAVRVPAGSTARLVAVPARALEGLLRSAVEDPVVHWGRNGLSVLVHLDQLEVGTSPGAVVVGVPTETTAGTAMVRLPFAVGRADRAAGMIAVASRYPEGPTAVVENWAEPLLATAWQALVLAAAAVAAAAGTDERDRPLRPLALRATRAGLGVVPGAVRERTR